MALVEENLWRNVLRRAANGVGALLNMLGKAVVNQLQKAISADHDVLRFQVAIHDILTVQIFENACDLRSIESNR